MPTTLALGWRRTRIELRQFFRDKESAFFTFALPMFLMIIFGSVFNTEIAPGVTFAQYFVAGMIASGVVYTGFQNLAITIPQERDDGTLKRLQGTPMPKASYFIGKIGLVLVAYVAQVILLGIIGVLFFKLELPTEASKWLTFAWVSVLGLLCCTLLGLAFSSVPKSGRGAPAIVSPVVLVLQFTSGVFFVFSQLPVWMQHLASLFPLKWLVQGMQSVFLPESFASQTTGTDSWQLGQVALVLGIWTIGGLAVALLTFRWQSRSR
ncbi:MAG TPA: ABC transporter [Actinobacteria bacterium]|nr:ABC transporter [Actinomycetota bacterium]